ncbi:phenylalanine--tRNA ligase subunit alpha [Patescibacteria group bacterium]|nr:phenylalanine--tRNA ligase subunit alpha [Patescibacteria group bacterium]
MTFTKTATQIKKSALNELAKTRDINTLAFWRKEYLGKVGKFTKLTRQIAQLPAKERASAGKAVNELKQALAKALQEREKQFHELPPSPVSRSQLSTFFDLTAPGADFQLGHLHPITQMRQYAEDIFVRMGFEVFEAREVDDDYHNFESLNMPPQHPARDLWDTFWTEDELVLITHTSSMQHRILLGQKPPIRAIIVGRCFRHEATDASHEHTLNQIEGLYVDKGIKLPDLIGTFKKFLDEFSQRDIKMKIQPSHFPFVEPGIEFLLDCAICFGTGEVEGERCSTCGGSGWLELAGAGMVHPSVLAEAGLDPQKYSGFAWGFGLDRLVMVKYGIENIRHFYSGDLRFIRQF